MIAVGRRALLFAGSELAGQRAAVVMSLVQLVRLNGHDPWVYLKNVLTRLPAHMNTHIDELLPHRWQPPSRGHARPAPVRCRSLCQGWHDKPLTVCSPAKACKRSRLLLLGQVELGKRNVQGWLSV